MNLLIYLLVKGLVAFIQLFPLPLVAAFGRAAGGLASLLDRPHRKVAIQNLAAAFPEKSPAEIRALATENFKRLGENYCSAIKTASMSNEQLAPHLDFAGAENLAKEVGSTVFAIGHFGNFELYARGTVAIPGVQFSTTYRALSPPGLNKVLVELRERSGCLFFERRTDSEALRAAVRAQKLIIGFLSDQHAGRGGVWVAMFGRICSTTTAPALFAMRYKLPLYPAICFRTSLAHWRIEVGKEIPTSAAGQRRSVEEVMLDVNRAFEQAIRRDPANWFWVHRRWKPAPANLRSSAPKPAQPADALPT